MTKEELDNKPSAGEELTKEEKDVFKTFFCMFIY